MRARMRVSDVGASSSKVAFSEQEGPLAVQGVDDCLLHIHLVASAPRTTEAELIRAVVSRCMRHYMADFVVLHDWCARDDEPHLSACLAGIDPEVRIDGQVVHDVPWSHLLPRD